MLGRPTRDQIRDFVNALQLCVKSQVASLCESNSARYALSFHSIAAEDENLGKLAKLIPGEWNEKQTIYYIPMIAIIDWQLMIPFLMLSRLKDQNIIILAQLDPRYRAYAKKLGLTTSSTENTGINSVRDAAQTLFNTIKEKKMTLREVALRSGLTQVALSRFKSGKDIRLSSLLKIAKAIDIHLYLSLESTERS